MCSNLTRGGGGGASPVYTVSPSAKQVLDVVLDSIAVNCWQLVLFSRVEGVERRGGGEVASNPGFPFRILSRFFSKAARQGSRLKVGQTAEFLLEKSDYALLVQSCTPHYNLIPTPSGKVA